MYMWTACSYNMYVHVDRMLLQHVTRDDEACRDVVSEHVLCVDKVNVPTKSMDYKR